MEPLATLPVFFKLRGKSVAMAGGGEPAVWKAELLAAAGAHVRVHSPDPCPGMEALAAEVLSGGITLVRRRWESSDLQGAAMAIGAIEDDAEAETFRRAAKEAGVPVNVVDKPSFCDFQFGTIVARSPLVIGISTDGAAPVFGQALRTRIEALLPQGLRSWAQAAKDWRPLVQAEDLDFRRRRRFWEVFTERAMASPDAAPVPSDLQACLDAVLLGERAITARISLVGTGKGTPDTITLQAVGVLQSADAVFYDQDTTPAVIGLARREAARFAVDPDDDAPSLEAIAGLVEERKHVAWVGTGNPGTCRRWAERLSGLTASGRLEPDVIQGLSTCPRCPVRCLFAA